MAPKKGFDDDNDSADENEAHRRMVERMQQAGRDDEPATGDDEELELPGNEPEPEPETRETRRERRAERGRIRDENAELRERLNAQDRELAEMRGRLSAIPAVQPPPQPKTDDPLVTEAKGLRNEWEGYLAKRNQAVQAQATAEQLRAIDEEGWDIRDRMGINTAKRAHAQQAPQGGLDPAQAQAQFTRMRLEQDHPDIMSDPKRARAFFANMQRRVHALGQQDNWETVAQAMDDTRKDLRLPMRGPRPAPSETTRRRLSGVGRGGDGGGGERRESETIRVKPEDRQTIERIANVTMRHLPKKDRLNAYLKHYGSKIRQHVEKR